jgi:hypothetical protein
MNSARAAATTTPKRVSLTPEDSLAAAPVKTGPVADEDWLPGDDDPLPGLEPAGDAGRPVEATAPTDAVPLAVG